MELCQAEPHKEHMQFMSLHCRHHEWGEPFRAGYWGISEQRHHCLLICWTWGKGIVEEDL